MSSGRIERGLLIQNQPVSNNKNSYHHTCPICDHVCVHRSNNNNNNNLNLNLTSNIM